MTGPSAAASRSHAALYLMLRNRTYRGEIVHKGQSHPGELPPIIDQPLWDGVQAQLTGNSGGRNAGTGTSATELQARMAERNPRPRGQPLEPGIAIDLQDALKAAEMRRGSLGLTIRAVHRQKNRAASCRRTRPTPSRNYPRGRNQPLPAGAFLECGGVIL